MDFKHNPFSEHGRNHITTRQGKEHKHKERHAQTYVGYSFSWNAFRVSRTDSLCRQMSLQ